MNAIIQDWTVDNAAWKRARPFLSVLIPFLHDDPRRLIQALDREAKALKGQVEVVLLDDGGGDDELVHQVIEAVEALRLPARLIRLVVNEGRSKGRNRLARHARGDRLLFLDSDMLPDAPDFLARYVAVARDQDPAVAFGGFSLAQVERRPEHALHCKLASRSDCAPAAVRGKAPEKYVFTSNLLVRRNLFEAQPFDETFSGWGWEDVEWGIRVAEGHAILHLDNPATHLGLDTAAVIAQKYEQSGGNFARILEAHPDVVRRYPTYRAARILKLAPLAGLWRPLLKAFAVSEIGPVALRAFSMRLYRIAVSAEALP